MHLHHCYKLFSLSTLGTLASLSLNLVPAHAAHGRPFSFLATSNQSAVNLAAWQEMLNLAFSYPNDSVKIIQETNSALTQLSILSNEGLSDWSRYLNAMSGLERLENILIANVNIVPASTFAVLRKRIFRARTDALVFRKESERAHGKLAPHRSQAILQDTVNQVNQALVMTSAIKGIGHAK